MFPRVDFQKLLESIFPEGKVYFQPPVNLKVTPPFITYDYSSVESRFADDGRYLSNRRYSVQLVTRDPDDPVVDRLLDLRFSQLERHFVTEMLHHYNFTIHY